MTGMGVKVREKVKGSGEYWIFINHDNFRKSKKIGKKVTAEKVANQVRARLALGDLSLIEETKTFQDYADIWQLGHSSLRMTLDIYGHYIPKTSTRRGVDVLDDVKKESI